MKIDWDTDLETGLSVLDQDHRMTIAIFNEISDCYAAGGDQMLLERAIANFKFQFTLHLLREENMMTTLGYPDFQSHAREHQTMVDLLERFSRAGRDADDSCQKIAFLVLQWISSHLNGADRRLATFIRNVETRQLISALSGAAPPETDERAAD